MDIDIDISKYESIESNNNNGSEYFYYNNFKKRIYYKDEIDTEHAQCYYDWINIDFGELQIVQLCSIPQKYKPLLFINLSNKMIYYIYYDGDDENLEFIKLYIH